MYEKMPKKIFYSGNADSYPGIVARNNAVYEYEKFVQRMFYPYSIHPYSPFRIYWEMSFIGIIPCRITIFFFFWAVVEHFNIWFIMLSLLFQILNFLDVFLKFFTGYVESGTEIVVLDRKLIFIRYMKTAFFFDFIPCIPIDFILFIISGGMTSNFDENLFLQYCKVMHYIYFTILFRMFTFVVYCKNIAKIMLWNYFMLGIVCVSLVFWCITLFANNFLFKGEVSMSHSHPGLIILNVPLFKKGTFASKAASFFEGLLAIIIDCLFFNSIPSINDIYFSYLILINVFFGGILFSAYFIKFVMTTMKAKEKLLDLESRVYSFVRQKHLPSTLRFKTTLYFQVLLQNNSYRDDEIFNYIPDTYKAEIFYHLCLPLLKNFYAFEDLPIYVLRRLAECMIYQLCLPNEIIMRGDEIRLSMYFVQRGTIALFSTKHIELYHFEAGSSFNGKHMILGEAATHNYAISIEISEIYLLHQTEFQEIMKTYPKLLAEIEKKLEEEKTASSGFVE